MKFGYARVSTSDQKADLQIYALLGHGVERGRIDIASERRAERPEPNSLLKALRGGGELVVWRLDRIGRSTKDVLGLVDQFAVRCVEFVSLHEWIETKSATGKLMLTVFAAIAGIERDLLAERANAGLAAARARGRKGDRSPAVMATDIRLARTTLSDSSVYVTDVAKHFKIGRNTLY